MSTIYELPLSPQPQHFRANIGGTTYTLHFRWNQFLATWVMDIHDADDLPLVVNNAGGGLNGVPLVTGTDLFGQFRYLGIGGGLPAIVMTIGPGRSPDELPTFQNLGIDSHVYFKTLA